MSGLVLCIVLAVGAALTLRVSGARGIVLAGAAIALVCGVILFSALQDDESVAAASSPATHIEYESLAPVRHAFTGQFTGGERWLAMADSMAARGNSADAAGILIAAVKLHPRDYTLWTGLGTMLTEHGGGLNPGAELAFQRAIDLSPGYPTPRYFYGIAKLQSGDREGALAEWQAVLAVAPANASWRGLVENRIRATRLSPAPD
ncbi:MAG: tetratricopeptide repeat protein [Sphingomicrobium sp.]